jgi:prevent-host-death family protein
MQISVTQFRARCSTLIREVEQSGQPLTITRRGRTVAILRPTLSAGRGGRPWEQLRSLGGEVHAAPGESVLTEADFAAAR